MSLKILIDDKIPFIGGRLEQYAAVSYLAPENFTREAVADADAIIVRTRTQCGSGLLGGSRVQLVVTATIGTDHIDLDWCRSEGIAVANAAGCNAPGVAQYVWSSLLRGGFVPGRDVMGVVGCGNVGSIVADWGRRLGAEVIVCDPPRQRAGFQDEDYRSLEDVLRTADAVSLHTPLTHGGPDATYHMVGTRELGMMKRGAVLVNAARGPVADGEALLRWIEAGQGRGMVDVWENEPDIDPRLLHAAEVATPHIAGYSREGKERATRMALEAVGNHFGFMPDTTGLAGPWRTPSGTILPQAVSGSYDPAADTAALRANPGDFEKLRGSYHYRPEPRFT